MLLRILLFSALSLSLVTDAHSGSKLAYYRVKSGDTLGKIAYRHGTTARRLLKINRLPSSLLRVGKTLKVPGARRAVSKRRRRRTRRPASYQVRWGDTLSKVANRFGVSTTRLARWNRMSLRSVLRTGKWLRLRPPGRRRARRKRKPPPLEKSTWQVGERSAVSLLPHDYAKPGLQSKVFREKEYTVTLYAHRFARGHAIYLEVEPKTGEIPRPTVSLAGKDVPLTRRPFGYRAIMGLSAYSSARLVQLQVRLGSASKSYALSIADSSYPIVTWKRYLGNYDKVYKVSEQTRMRRAKNVRARKALIAKSSAKKKQVFAIKSEDMFGSRTAHPRGRHRVTSAFFTNRKIVRYYRKHGRKQWHKPYYLRHKGLDLAGRVGTNIYAIADGKVVCSQLMYYEGNYTIIDHGNGIFSGYMHQSQMLAREGRRVKAGEILGKVGKTGKVTGPHLHASLWIRGKPVHPLSIIGLPIR